MDTNDRNDVGGQPASLLTSSPAKLPIHRSLLAKQTLVITMAVVLTALALALASFYFARRVLRDQIGDRLSVVTTDREAMVSAYVAQQHERAALVASRTHLRQLVEAHLNAPDVGDVAFIAESARILRDARQSTEGFVDLWIADPEGKVITSTNECLLGGDFSDTQEFQIGLKHTHIGVPRKVDGGYFAYLSAPVRSNDGRELGVAMALLDVTPLVDLLMDKSGLGGTGGVLVGTLDADWDDNKIRYLIPSETNSEQFSDPAKVTPMTRALRGESGFADTMFAGKCVLAAYCPVAYQSEDVCRWGMVAKIDRDEAYAPIADLQRLMLLLVVALLAVGLAVSYAVARKHTHPILELANSAARVANGDLTVRVDLNTCDEISVLGQAFNEMTKELEESYHNLEARVEERTRDLEKARDAEQQANRVKTDFLANMSHEIRTPLNAIIGMTDLVLDSNLDAMQRDNLTTVSESADSLLEVINEILDFSRIESGNLKLDAVEFNLREVIGDTLKSLGSRAHAKNLELIWHVHPNVPSCLCGDSVLLRQVLINLVGNAIKFTDEGEVIVDVAREPSHDAVVTLNFSVRDTGIGIPVEKREKIFSAFEQVDNSTTRQFGGTGLGLAISSDIAKAMGGRIWVNDAPDCGSEFHFTSEFTEGSRHQHEEDIPELKGVEALVVDDNETNRRILKEMLQNWGMSVETVEGGRQALDALERILIEQRSLPLVISDVNMPEMDGIQLVEEIRSMPRLREMKIILLTSGMRQEDIPRCRDLGVSAQMMKPVKQSELRKSIALTVGRESMEPASEIAKADRPDLIDVPPQRVLLVEDGKSNQKLAMALLSKWGHEIVLAENGEEAVLRWQNDVFDVILMDIQMPVMDGLEATRRIRELEKGTGRRVPIIAVTARAMQGDRQRCLDAGMDNYVSKPMRKKELYEALRGTLSHRNVGFAVDDSIKNGQCARFIVDWNAALGTAGGDEELLLSIVDAVLEELPLLMGQLDDAILGQNVEVVRRVAHTVRGTGRALSAARVVESAAAVEEPAANNDLNQASENVAALRVTVDRFIQECNSFAVTHQRRRTHA